MAMWTVIVDRCRDYEVFLHYLLVVIAADCENISENDKLFVMRETVSVTRPLFVTVRCARLTRLVR